ncbi:MAG: PIG-L family deacetylase [Clostridia bacterium]|nr:PIG-L family deacetylase [Clostridia bacterium]
MKILAIGAHQDDNEFRVGGIAHKWVKAGHTVRFLSMCNGCGGHHVMTPEETSARRYKESMAVAEYLGVEYDIWDIDDCTLMADLETRMRLIRYIREFSPDLIIAHRTNDYHADHRASAQLVQDASYILTVPHTCPDVPAMRHMPVIMYNEDRFINPEFKATHIVDLDDEIETKLHICHLNESQVYEWLPYTHGETVPTGEKERYEWLKGMNITQDTTDKEVMAASRGYAVRFAKTAARFRNELIERYGEERGSRVRFAEAFELCDYGEKPSEELNKQLFGF